MGDVSKEVLSLFTQLLPGFVTAWVVFGLTAYPRPAQFERLIQAVIYSFFVGALVSIEQKIFLYCGKTYSFGVWDKPTELIASAVTAVLLGLVFSYYSANDKFYKLFRYLKITSRTAYPSEWYGAFATHKCYVILHFEDLRRITGFPIEWPSDPAIGHFRLGDAAWITDDQKEIDLGMNESILISAKMIVMVEFLKFTEGSNGAETT